MTTSIRNREQSLETLLQTATDLHGHSGPFLTLGVRMGLIGLRELGTKEGNTDLHVTAALRYDVPFSCMLDGIQTSTRCTVGNKRLTWKESEKFGAVFLLRNTGRRVDVEVKSAVVQELSRRLANKESMDEQVRQLANEIASRPEEELFSVRHK